MLLGELTPSRRVDLPANDFVYRAMHDRAIPHLREPFQTQLHRHAGVVRAGRDVRAV